MDKLGGVHEERMEMFRIVTTKKIFSKRGPCKQKIDLGVPVKKSLRTPAIGEAKIREPDKIA